MDPDANLKELSELFNGECSDMDRAVELVEALRDWIRGGGFVPKITGITNFDRMIIEAVAEYIILLSDDVDDER